MNGSEYLENTDEIAAMYLDLSDDQIAAAENILLEVTGASGDEKAELALSALTLCLIGVFMKGINAAYLSGLAHGRNSSSLGNNHAVLKRVDHAILQQAE